MAKSRGNRLTYASEQRNFTSSRISKTIPEIRTEIVRWQTGEEEYCPCCTTSGFSLPYSEDGYEVIGNVHENPEFLEANDVD